jgi:hypothetical protein
VGALMGNPWEKLPKERDFVLESDKELILAFNEKVKNEDHKIHLELLPEPYLGNPDAEIILLNLNPGFSTDDLNLHRHNDYFVSATMANLLHIEQEYPFYFLDPEIVKARGRDQRGRDRWWNRILGDLIGHYGAAAVANHVFCIEFFPYHSKKYKALRDVVPSQHYSFSLVRKAIQRGALIVLMRSKSKWLKAVPELADYEYYELSSVQSAYVTRNNLPGGFDKIVEILKPHNKRSLSAAVSSTSYSSG